MTLKHALKQWALRCGIEVHRYNAVESPEARMARQLAVHEVTLVIDVGANDGGYGRMLRGLGYQGRILSFEPLPEAHAALSDGAAGDDRWHIAPRMALGAEDGEIAINIAANSASSSILPMGILHQQAAPESLYRGRTTVPLRRLDGVGHAALQATGSMLLKIDTQGYEMAVLQGAAALLGRLQGVQVELSVVPLYEGQADYRDVTTFLEAAGFGLWNVTPGFTDPRDGRMLQYDGIFFRAPP